MAIRVQRIEVEEERVVAESARETMLNRNVSKVSGQTTDFEDPITNTQGSISIAGLSKIIESFAELWIMEDLGGVVGPSGYVEVE